VEEEDLGWGSEEEDGEEDSLDVTGASLNDTIESTLKSIDSVLNSSSLEDEPVESREKVESKPVADVERPAILPNPVQPQPLSEAAITTTTTFVSTTDDSHSDESGPSSGPSPLRAKSNSGSAPSSPVKLESETSLSKEMSAIEPVVAVAERQSLASVLEKYGFQLEIMFD
jgi:hypothetical protein